MALNRQAVAAANVTLWSNHPELKGRQLGLGPADAAYRKIWTDAYQRALAISPGTEKPVASSVEPCPLCDPVAFIVAQKDEPWSMPYQEKFKDTVIPVSENAMNYQIERFDEFFEKHDNIIKEDVVGAFSYDSNFHDGAANQAMFNFRDRTLTGSELNYYFQGAIAARLHIPLEGHVLIARAWKATNYQVELSKNSIWAMEQGYSDTVMRMNSPQGSW